MAEFDDTSKIRDVISQMRKVAKELRNIRTTKLVKTAKKELDPQQVLNFIRFFGADYGK